MANQVNYARMRERLEFLYYLLNYNFADMMTTHRMNSIEAEAVNSQIATIAINLIYIQRADSKALITHEASKKIQAISQRIADELVRIAGTIQNECAGIPKEAIPDRYDVILQNGLDHVIEVIKKNIESEEVSNG